MLEPGSPTTFERPMPRNQLSAQGLESRVDSVG